MQNSRIALESLFLLPLQPILPVPLALRSFPGPLKDLCFIGCFMLFFSCHSPHLLKALAAEFSYPTRVKLLQHELAGQSEISAWPADCLS
jgi:hypothetical protein